MKPEWLELPGLHGRKNPHWLSPLAWLNGSGLQRRLGSGLALLRTRLPRVQEDTPSGQVPQRCQWPRVPCVSPAGQGPACLRGEEIWASCGKICLCVISLTPGLSCSLGSYNERTHAQHTFLQNFAGNLPEAAFRRPEDKLCS